MAKSEYNWLDDPFDPEKQAQDEEELTRAKSNGLIVLLVVIIALVVFGGLFLFGGSVLLGLISNGVVR